MSNENSEENKANAFLRERFLYLLSSSWGSKRSTIRMFDNTEVIGVVKAIDLNFQNVIVENLKTPLPTTLKAAVLRTADILSMQFE